MSVTSIALLTALLAQPKTSDSAGVDFFETNIRPVLVQRCYKCHSNATKAPKGALRLDTRVGIRQGGDSGPAVTPGVPDESLLLAAIRYESLEMPPEGQLDADVIADFERWIQLGAPDPRDNEPTTETSNIDYSAARRHWAYQPIQKPELPDVRDSAWARSPIDRLIASRLDTAGLTPSPRADPRTLIRRLYYDLVGLPPTFEEVETFVSDPSQQAFERVIDRLLDSPHYGERWGRHWLDVARYADTKDLVLLYGTDALRPYAYTYRDYVIKSFNSDLPYNRFIEEQLAADRLAKIEADFPRESLAAMGFLTLGRMFDNNPHDIYDDRIDTVSRGLLALTVSCARCHDHKYDAIPTQDYYSLYGVFASAARPLELPLIDEPKNTPGGVEFIEKSAKLREEFRKFLDEQYEKIGDTARMRVSDYLVKVVDDPPDPLEQAVFFMSLIPGRLKPPIVGRWRRHLAQVSEDDPVFGLWPKFMQLSAEEFEGGANDLIAKTDPGQINPLVLNALKESKLSTQAEVAQAYGELLRDAYVTSKESSTTSTAEPPDDATAQLLTVITGPRSPTWFQKSKTYLLMDRPDRDAYHSKEREIDKLAIYDKGAPPRAMVLVDVPGLYDPRVFRRGDPGRPGQRVPRRFLRILAGKDRQPFPDGGGRLDLARAVTAPDNPLTARVIVNRVWMHHFGEPLVSTPSDFGTRSEPPSHPKLLDYLASYLGETRWSLKALHRLILQSRTWQQASFDRPSMREKDPDNELLWRTHRRRLDLEAMRDTLLAVSGRLDRTLFGRPVDIAENPDNRRRTVYGIVDRQNLPALFRSFDFASPDASAARRTETTVPQQALFGLNSPFVIAQAKALATRSAIGNPTPKKRVDALYRTAFARRPTAVEVDRALRFVADANLGQEETETKLTTWQQLAQILLLTNELMFVD